MDDNDEIVKEFLIESYENLDQLDRDFVALETDPSSAADRLASIFRTIHTIKGTCGILGFVRLESVAHVGENLLSRLRDGALTINSDMTTALLQMVDAVREILSGIEAGTGEGNKDYSPLIDTLRALNEETGAASHETGAPAHETAPSADPAPLAPAEAAAGPSAEVLAEVAAAAEPAAKEAASGSVSGNAIRVDVGLLDQLMNLVGELVLTRNQVLQHALTREDTAFLSTTQRLNLITTELQESVMKTRMQPIGGVWNKFPRLVRDLAKSCGKRVRIEMEGRDTELDKTIVEAIKDPLTHVIRNSVDHGVESPAERRAAGKNEEGLLFMRAYHEGGQVNIEITDDGKGIDPERVKKKALQKGLITPDQAARMGEREAVALIFLPGFSTAEQVTNVSGRGVGMDVVKTNVEKIGGTVDVVSRVGHGTTLKIKIPLTLAIIPALVVSSGQERFAIPQVSLLELLRVEADGSGIEMIHGTPVYRLRGNLLPLIYLNRELRIGGTGGQSDGPAAANIVVLRGGDQQFGLVVDNINDTEEIVVKPLSKQLKGISVFAGATIMGDGRVALILDVVGLAQRANVISQGAEASTRKTAQAARGESGDRQTLLLFRVENDRRMAIPLSIVARLEEFPRKRIEDAGGQPVVQYRGQIMPLVNVAQVLGDRRGVNKARRAKKDGTESEMIQVVVYSDHERSIGLHVEQILDVVEEHVVAQTAAARPGVLGTAVLKDRVTELLDVPTLVAAAGQISAKAA